MRGPRIGGCDIRIPSLLRAGWLPASNGAGLRKKQFCELLKLDRDVDPFSF